MNRQFRKAIIFDMDNTLLQSKIDFPAMKRAIYELWVENGICEPTLDWEQHTASQLIEIGRRAKNMTAALESHMWEAVTAIEKEGMHKAVLEAGAAEILEQLHQSYYLFILTNNAYAAAQEALQETKIIHYFDEVVAREQMTMLKPSPSGITYILNQYPDLPASAWTMIGDSWIDGKAAQDGHVRFIAYHGKPQDMERQGVVPQAFISDLRELLTIDLGE